MDNKNNLLGGQFPLILIALLAIALSASLVIPENIKAWILMTIGVIVIIVAIINML